MKKILLFTYLSVFLVLLCTEGFRVSSSASAAPACTQSAVQSVKVRQVAVHFYCGINTSEQAQIAALVAHALDAMLPTVLQPAQVYAFTNLDQGLAAEYGFLKSEGYHRSISDLEADWLDRELLGQTFKGAVFLYLGNSAWNRDPVVPALTVLHEMYHLMQYQLLDSPHQAPLWLLEGGADAFALHELNSLALPVPVRNGTSYRCDYSLSDLEYAQEGVPLACAYLEGSQAVSLLLDRSGQQAYYQLFRNIGINASFDDAFMQTYGFRLLDFYTRFDRYRESGYTVRPVLAISFPKP